MLTPSQREAVDAALKGYLSDYEALWRAGSISDYHLFPAGRFKKGKAKVKVEPLALTRDAALGMFHELERIAGVTEVPGRGWYGVRRIATDIAEDVEKDERVLNNMTGASGLDYSAACIPGSRAAIGAKQGCSNKRPRPPKGYDRFTESGDKAPIPLVREEKTA